MKLYKATKLTPIDVPAVPGCEGLNEEVDKEVSVSTETLNNDTPPQNPQQKPQPVFQFCVIPDGNIRKFYFYLNEPAFFSEVMQLTNLLSTATTNDIVYISIGAVVSQNAARLLISILQNCPAKVIADAPFLMSIYAASILTACNEIKCSPYMIAMFDYPQINAGGGIGDAEEALKFNKAEFEATINLLVEKELMTTAEAEELRKQRLCMIPCAELDARYRAFNAKQK